MPTLDELASLFGVLPELPLPVPRKRIHLNREATSKSAVTVADVPGSQPGSKSKSVSFEPTTQKHTTVSSINSASPSAFQRLFFLLPSWLYRRPASLVTTATESRLPPRPNPFPALKQGKKMIVIAVVDAGSVGFFRFSQGTFEDWPMV
jgi:tRNA-splicing endonuclease subunit Sen54